MADGMPIEGEVGDGDRVGHHAQPATTCGPQETIRAVRERAGDRVCVVVSDEGVVLGLLGEDQLGTQADLDPQSDRRAGEVMQGGPTTFRPSVPVSEMTEYLAKHRRSFALVTKSTGELVGLFSGRMTF